MALTDSPVEMRLRGTDLQLRQLIDQLKCDLGTRVLEVSRYYKDRGQNTYRVYIKIGC